MHTVDIHSHLLNPEARFDRLYDKITIHFFAKKLGVDPVQLQRNPYGTFVTSMAKNVTQSEYVERACIFGVDCRLNQQGKEIDRDSTVCAMTSDVLEVAASHPGVFIPFMSINPRRINALDLIDEYAEQGCRGAKFLQNYWGIDLNDRCFIPYYEKLKSHNLPLIIHIGSEYSVDSDLRYERADMLKLPLETGLTVIAAHMGLGRIHHKLLFWKNLSRNPKTFDEDYFILLDMLQNHDNLYADISAILVPLRARALRHLSQQQEIHHKLLFGTDYPVPFSIRFNTHDLSSAESCRIEAISNPFDRYARTILAYFPEESPLYSNYKKILVD
ncbi:MAG: amidohydrolase family protein [Candidatus Polarisedimenticolaceae bacterium]|nr:amidohydrolase family protein [Candidatus Polarisedimenticolaceae bacterium]